MVRIRQLCSNCGYSHVRHKGRSAVKSEHIDEAECTECGDFTTIYSDKIIITKTDTIDFITVVTDKEAAKRVHLKDNNTLYLYCDKCDEHLTTLRYLRNEVQHQGRRRICRCLEHEVYHRIEILEVSIDDNYHITTIGHLKNVRPSVARKSLK